jgi:hypothetical protein
MWSKPINVPQACNPSYLGDGVPGHSVWKTKFDTISTNKKSGMVVHACHTSYVESVNRRVVVQAGLDTNMKPYWKNN